MRMALVVAFSFWALSGTAEACSCSRGPSLPGYIVGSFLEADAVILGNADAVEDNRSSGLLGTTRVRFRPYVFLKGQQQEEVLEMLGGLGWGECGFIFEPNVSYVVFAYRNEEGRLGTGLCTPSAPAYFYASLLGVLVLLPLGALLLLRGLVRRARCVRMSRHA